jgi:hypothetical protein
MNTRWSRAVTAFVRDRWYIVAAFLAATALVYWYLERNQFRAEDPRDAKLLVFAGLAILPSIGIAVVRFRPWTFAVVFALGVIAFGAGLQILAGQWWAWRWHEPTRRDLNILRALLITSGGGMVFLYVWFVAMWIRGRWVRRRTGR